MRVIAILFFLIFTICSIYGQETTPNYTLADTTLANAYKDTSYMMSRKRDFKQAINYTNKTIEIYKRLNIIDIRFAKHHNNIGAYNRRSGNFEEAVLFFNKALKIYEELEMVISEGYAYSLDQKGIALRYLAQYEKSIEFSLRSLEIFDQIDNPKLSSAIAPYNNLAIIHRIKSEFDEAIRYAKIALKVIEDKAGVINETAAGAYNTIGTIYREQGKYEEALEYFHLSLHVYESIEGKEHPKANIIKQNIGIVYAETRDYDKAISYFKNALEGFIKIYGQNNRHSSLMYGNIGELYRSIQNYDKAFVYLEKKLELTKQIYKNNHPSIADCHLSLGLIHKDVGQFDMAMFHYQKSLDIYSNFFNEDNIAVGRVFINISSLFLAQNEIKDALIYANKALKIHEKNYGVHNFKTSLVYNNIAICYYFEKDYENALIFYQKCLNARIKSLGAGNMEVVGAYLNLGNLFQVQKKYQKALEYFNKAVLIIEDIQNSNLDIARDYFQRSTHLVYEDMISSHLRLNTINHQNSLDEVFVLAEKSKTINLLKAIVNSKAKQFASIPDSLIEKENYLKNNANYYAVIKRTKLLEGISEYNTEVLELDNTILEYKEELNRLKKFFEKKYPVYFKSKYHNKVTTVENVQHDLLPDQSMIEYVNGDSFLYTIVINPDTFIIQETPMDFPLNEWVTSFREGLTAPTQFSKTNRNKLYRTYIEKGQQLYEKLIAPIAPFLNQELIIVPDGVLGYVPFEALLSGTPEKMTSFHTYPYLLNKYSISYSYSATLLKEMKDKQHRNSLSKNSLCIAPFYEGDIDSLYAVIDTTELLSLRGDTLTSLKYSGEEVAKIAKVTNGETWIGKKASRERFLAEAPNYKILHLSTHGVANDKVGDYAYLSFQNPDNNKVYDKLYVRDIYNIPLNADMVVLSACNTAYGKLQKGEGIISMARAFAYAGAKSIVTTHWSINDKSTSELMTIFYQELLQNGISKGDALQKAKLKFIKENRPSAYPFYWAAFVGIGDMSPIQN